MRLLLESVSFNYSSGVSALRSVDLEIRSGDSVALVGANGAGKTTLAKHFNGLLRPVEGRVVVGDWDAAGRSVAELARRVAYAFQNPEDQLFESTVRSEVEFGPRNLGLDEHAVGSRVAKAMDLVGLSESWDSHPYDLNSSERKMVALAATLAMEAPITILDEPTSGQDAKGIARVEQAIRWLAESERTILAISHDLDFCAENFARVVVMKAGQIIGDGPAERVLADVELLAEADVEPPQLIRLSHALGLPGAPRTVSTFLHDLEAWKRSEEMAE